MLAFADANAHKPDEEGKGVWKRQLGADGVQNANTGAWYRVQLLNLSRSIEPMELAGYLREALKTRFYMYSLDTYGPRSKFSLQLEILFETTTCPTQLVDVHRIYWKGEVLLAHHVSRQRQPPCLICGKPGHFAKTCKAANEDLKTKNCLQFTEEETTKVTTKPTTYRSMDELRGALTQAAKAQLNV